MNEKPIFEKMPMSHKPLGDDLSALYKVYKTPTDFVVVRADSALEAIAASGVKPAYKVMREGMHLRTVLDWDGIEALFKSPVNNPVVEAAVAAPPVA